MDIDRLERVDFVLVLLNYSTRKTLSEARKSPVNVPETEERTLLSFCFRPPEEAHVSGEETLRPAALP